MRNAYATHTDYAEFKGLIPENPNFVPSNVDGICERKGKFLVMEWKRQGEKVSKGQQILLQSLASLHNFMVVIISAGLPVSSFTRALATAPTMPSFPSLGSP